ncbi:MAG: hypothetical protein KDK66_02785 [Deltaproteobacteria bacterium]|nr:hypothetical protein [Deltaproteobacteria bacterium]
MAARVRPNKENLSQEATEICKAFAGDPQTTSDDIVLIQPTPDQLSSEVIDSENSEYFKKCEEAIKDSRNLISSYWNTDKVAQLRKAANKEGIDLGAGLAPSPSYAYTSTFNGVRRFVLALDGPIPKDEELFEMYVAHLAYHEAGHALKDHLILEKNFPKRYFKYFDTSRLPSSIAWKLIIFYAEDPLVKTVNIEELSKEEQYDLVRKIEFIGLNKMYIELFRNRTHPKDRKEYDRLVEESFGDLSSKSIEELRHLHYLLAEALRSGEEAYDLEHKKINKVYEFNFQGVFKKGSEIKSGISYASFLMADLQEAGFWDEYSNPRINPDFDKKNYITLPDGRKAFRYKEGDQEQWVLPNEVLLFRLMIQAARTYHDETAPLASLENIELAGRQESLESLKIDIWPRESGFSFGVPRLGVQSFVGEVNGRQLKGSEMSIGAQIGYLSREMPMGLLAGAGALADVHLKISGLVNYRSLDIGAYGRIGYNAGPVDIFLQPALGIRRLKSDLGNPPNSFWLSAEPGLVFFDKTIAIYFKAQGSPRDQWWSLGGGFALMDLGKLFNRS